MKKLAPLFSSCLPFLVNHRTRSCSRTKSLVALVALLTGASHAALGQVCIFEFAGSPTGNNQFNEVTAQPAHATVSPFTRHGVNFETGDNVFNSSNWTQNSVVDPSTYVGFSITMDSGFSLDITTLSFTTFKYSALSPNNVAISLFLDGATTTPLNNDVDSNSNFPRNHIINYSPVITGASSAEFRFYGVNAFSSTAQMYFDNISLQGTVSSVPEPRLYGWCFGVVMLGFATGRTYLKSLK